MARNHFTIEVEGLGDIFGLFDPKLAKKAMRSALDKSATLHRRLSFKSAAKVFNLSEARLKRTEKGGKATSYIHRTTQHKMRAIIGFKARRPGLQHFAVGRKKNYPPPKRRGPDVKLRNPKFKVFRSGGAKELKRGFFKTMPKGGDGLWQRKTGKRDSYVRKTGPSIKQMYNYPTVSGPLEKRLPRMVEGIFAVEYRNRLRKVPRRRR